MADYTTVVTAPPVDNSEQKESTSTYKTPTVKQKAVLLSSSKGNLEKILMLEIFSHEEQKGRNWTGQAHMSLQQ